MGFKGSYLSIKPRELVSYLLRETHADREKINPKAIIDLLKLNHITADFSAEFHNEMIECDNPARAMLSYHDRIVATDESMSARQTRFSVLHEIGHYVLPAHQHTLYLCDDFGMGFNTHLTMEREANRFAADLLFLGDRFTAEANSYPISAETVKLLATRYEASFEATARRLAENTIKPCMFVVFKKEGDSLDADVPCRWVKKYTIPSMSFRTHYCNDLSKAELSTEIAGQVAVQGRDIADSVKVDAPIQNTAGEFTEFEGEFFFNQHNVFCFLLPL